ncbi:SPOR domain-containing protein [Arenicella xantha]|uniref:Cell division septation protein DedD n=1 Tax=Arenicella xantha TaxID=644221 RepID=A0A395JMZ7_9GAMM|nr:SPOR domain-containing protein [Arenicella xantha]RBP50974.1 cell division septation protein DedD [Arenicella xantha]
MSDPNKSDVKLADEFNLKHRITGAAVLLFVGALVIPWLLGPPSEASKQPSASISESISEDISARDIENELLGLDRVDELPEETVYISKITPLDGSDSSDSVGVDEAVNKTESKESKPSDKPAVSAKSESVAVEEKAAPKKPDVDPPVTQATATNKPKPKPKEQSGSKSDSNSKAEEERRLQAEREKELKNALEAEAQTAEVRKIQVGWVVQVGLYTEKVGVDKKMAELSKQGFSPQSTIVDTNRGPKTGTRVWLGPFQKRPDAEAKNQELKSKTGKDGFIRVYP